MKMSKDIFLESLFNEDSICSDHEIFVPINTTPVENIPNISIGRKKLMTLFHLDLTEENLWITPVLLEFSFKESIFE